MPHQAPSHSVSFDQAKRRRTTTFMGSIHDDYLLEAYGSMLAEPGYDQGADELVDLSGVDHFDVSADGLRRLIEMFSQTDDLGHSYRVAIVAPASAVYGVSRMYQMLRGDDAPEEIAVFRDHAEAEAWLDAGRGNGHQLG